MTYWKTAAEKTLLLAILTMAASLGAVTVTPQAGATTGGHRSQTPKKEYLAAAARLNRAQTQFESALTVDPTPTTVKAAAPSLASADVTCAKALARVHWNGSSVSDARTLEKYLRASSAFLATANYQTSSTVASWIEQLKTLGQSGNGSIAALRKDLGLGPAPSTSSSTTTTTTTAAPAPITTTAAPNTLQYTTALGNFSSAAGGYSSAAGAAAGGDFAGISEACQRVESAIQAIQSLPVSPESDVRSEIQDGLQVAMSGYQMGCSSDNTDIQTEAVTAFSQASTDFTTAPERITQLAGN